MRVLSLLSLFLYQLIPSVTAQEIRHFHGDQTPTWEEAISAYEALAGRSDFASLEIAGMTDVGKPLHVFKISRPSDTRKLVLLVNNAIHPGEPCGVDASLMLAEDLLSDSWFAQQVLQMVDVYIIPMYNVGGALNRGCCSRANQNGPTEYGFRGNARNLDLNRDFIKCDSRNARSFTELFQQIRPNVFVDTHTTNGADYQYVMTLITTQPDKATPVVGNYMRDKMEPALYKVMERLKFPMTPYVNTLGRTPESGIADFIESPRFSTGYASLFNCIGFTTEAHMFKPYEDRVNATYFFLRTLSVYMAEHSVELIGLKEEADRYTASQRSFGLGWEIDTTKNTSFDFDGYQAIYETSELTGKERLRYDREQPIRFTTPWFHWCKTTDSVAAPHAYLVPQAWREVIDRLRWNGVVMQELSTDAEVTADTYYIESIDSPQMPYEGHFIHRNIKANPVAIQASILAGDVLIRLDQPSNRYIVETLEPKGTDSFLTWNFFDSILQQKEWFSDYIFEEEAKELLETDPELRAEFERMKAEREDFRNDPFAQLYFLYRNSPNYESTHNLYPVLRLDEATCKMLQLRPFIP